MKRQIRHALATGAASLLGIVISAHGEPTFRSSEGLAPTGQAFTYQGMLREGNVPVNETCDFWFSLWDAPEDGNQIGPTLAFDGLDTNRLPIAVANGLFAVALDFGQSAWNGQARWLDIVIACPTGKSTATPLAPRQPVTVSPYAAYAFAGPGGDGLWAVSGDNIHNTNMGHVGIGTDEPASSLDVVGDAANNAIRAQGTVAVTKGLDEPGTGLSVCRTVSTTPLTITKRTEIDGNRIDCFGLLGTGTSLILNAASTGSVGIGTNTPGRKLQVGDSTIPDSEGMIRLASRSGTQGSNRVWDVGVPETDGDSTGIGYSFVIDDTQAGEEPEVMVKFGSGDVGIGTVDPEAKLDVAGTTKTTALEIDGGAIRVAGAGANTSTAVFRHVPSMSNSRCDAIGNACHETTINHPLANNDPAAILLVTINGVFRQESDSTPPQVMYDTETDRWKIRMRWWDLPDVQFNVMIIKN